MSAAATPPASGSRRARKRGGLFGQDWFFAVALATFVGVAVWFGRAIEDFVAPTSPAIATPSLIGQTVADAVREAQGARLRAVVVSRQSSDRFPKDIVMRQQPVPGSKVREGRQISIVVSNGVEIFPMPDLREETLREVGLELSHDKLVLGRTKTVANDDVPAGTVVTQDPVPLTSVRVGSVVDLEISKGPPPAVRIPSFVNLSIDDARHYAIDQRVRLGQIVWTPIGRLSPPRGTVVRQNPSAGSLADSDARVSLQVSAGPDVTGYLLRQVHVAVVVPGEHAGEVRLVMHDGTGTWDLYDAYAQPRQRLDFNVTAIGSASLDLYVDNEELSQTTLGVEPPNARRNVYPSPKPTTLRPPGAGAGVTVTPAVTPAARR